MLDFPCAQTGFLPWLPLRYAANELQRTPEMSTGKSNGEISLDSFGRGPVLSQLGQYDRSSTAVWRDLDHSLVVGGLDSKRRSGKKKEGVQETQNLYFFFRH